MAANIPVKLKTADLTRFIIRAQQLETAKPIIAYWCKFQVKLQVNMCS
jgi:vacuolar protein sorting-associated protein VTA1